MSRKSTNIIICRLFTNIQSQHTNIGTRVVASLDIEKAFDTIEWPFFVVGPLQDGYPLVFINWLKVLYSSPSSSIRLSAGLSSSFSLARGTR